MPRPYFFDCAAADRAESFFSTYLTHVKGELQGQPIEILPWFRSILRNAFGWKRRSDGLRRYRTVYCEVPKKNAKSTYAAGVALKLLFADDEPGAEVYSAAADRFQASIVFGIAKQMVLQSPTLSRRARILTSVIEDPSTFSFYRVLSADVKTKHGVNAHGIVFDELHTQPSRDLWDTLRTSVASRRQPLLVAITTAGDDELSICYEVHTYAEGVLAGRIPDDTFLAAIYAAKRTDDPFDRRVWKRANPGYGASLQPTYLESEALKAKQNPAALRAFLRLHLDIWTEAADAWLPMDAWDDCGRTPIDREQLAGRPCYAGLDLASTTDLTALVLIFPPEGDEPLIVLPWFWVPQETIDRLAAIDQHHYRTWRDQGHLTATPENVVDYDRIEKKILELREIYDIQTLGYDPHGATQLVLKLAAAGLDVVPIRQGITLSPPSKELLRQVLSRRIAHGGHPVLGWNASNLVVRLDAHENVIPDRKKSRAKIDGAIALIMALEVLSRQGGEIEDDYYAENPLLTV